MRQFVALLFSEQGEKYDLNGVWLDSGQAGVVPWT